jgi:hypothetical protein
MAELKKIIVFSRGNFVEARYYLEDMKLPLCTVAETVEQAVGKLVCAHAELFNIGIAVETGPGSLPA